MIVQPWALAYAHKYYQESNQESKETCTNLIKTTFMALLLTTSLNPDFDNIFIMAPIFCTPIVEVIKEVLPTIKHVFSTRDPLESILCYRNVSCI